MNVKTEQLDLRHDVEAPRVSRRFVSSVLRRWSLGPTAVESAQLLVSELVSNAVLHGSGAIRVSISELSDGRVRIEVGNEGLGQPTMRHAAPHELSGRGLQIVDELAGGWGSTTGNGETRVWFEMHADAPA